MYGVQRDRGDTELVKSELADRATPIQRNAARAPGAMQTACSQTAFVCHTPTSAHAAKVVGIVVRTFSIMPSTAGCNLSTFPTMACVCSQARMLAITTLRAHLACAGAGKLRMLGGGMGLARVALVQGKETSTALVGNGSCTPLRVCWLWLRCRTAVEARETRHGVGIACVCGRGTGVWG